ncbi:hypothetical protein LIER_23240 [Lithospermum erythrorhizon]|uniref:Integrase catalytic domain-containing protein n=1 Tax=Lithospermum erythrorhizon TaxID=34254 RepID=A0AAV3QY22_LITER
MGRCEAVYPTGPRVGIPVLKTQFIAGKIEDLCLELDIEHRTASVSYPQANGQVEVMNRVIFKGIMKRLQEEGGCWDQELPTVLWWRFTWKVSYYDELANEQGLWLNLDLLEEKRAAAVDKMVRYKDKRVVGPDMYELETLEGRQVPRSWNICHLKKYLV